MYMDGRVNLMWDIVPLLTADLSVTPAKLFSYEGTGFLIAPGLLVTCWHCVETQRPGVSYCAFISRDTGNHSLHRLSNIGQDEHGTDLATANVDLIPTVGLEIGDELATGTDVYTFGYPLSRQERGFLGEIRIEIIGQFLQSYITRICTHIALRFGPTHSYELGMAAHRGLSGAPVLELRSKRVVGVVYGNNDYEQIEEFAAVDPETRERTPEVRRILSYGLAHHTATLRNLTGPATRGLPLADYIAQVTTPEVRVPPVPVR
jgi:hypothetical protein